MIRLLGIALFATTLVASAQMDKSLTKPVTDEQKLADALRAGPAFVTKDAVIADWPANPKDPNAQYRILRPGKSNWTCLPGAPGYPRTLEPAVGSSQPKRVLTEYQRHDWHHVLTAFMYGQPNSSDPDPWVSGRHAVRYRPCGRRTETSQASFHRVASG